MYPFPYKPESLKTNQPFVLKRGDVHQPAETVTPGVPAVLLRGKPRTGTGSVKGDPERQFATRLQLVDWLTSEAGPLTARVWVNYLWQQHFGRGLVATPADFGTHGAEPTHGALLDWLLWSCVKMDGAQNTFSD